MRISMLLFAASFIILIGQSAAMSENTELLPVEIGYDQAESGVLSKVMDPSTGPHREPMRDPEGPHDIYYDDGIGGCFHVWDNYWSRVTFTPESEFELRAVRVQFNNPYRVQEIARVLVFRENQRNNDLEEEVISFEVARPPNREWMLLEIEDEDDYVTFAEGENFSIVHGPAPGGDPDQGARGWWNIVDIESETNRSFMVEANEPPLRHRSWRRVATDIMMRANGEFTGDFDLALENLNIGNNGWSVMKGSEIFLRADLSNLGDNNPGDTYVDFWISDMRDARVWDRSVDLGVIEGDETMEIACEEPWIPDSSGTYILHAEVSTWEGSDCYLPNNVTIAERMVMGVDNPDTWIGFVNENIEEQWTWALWNYENRKPIGSVFEHPGGETPLAVKAIRANLDPDEDVFEIGTEITFQVYKIQPPDFEEELVWEGTSETESDNSHWVEVQIPDSNHVSIQDGQSAYACYLFNEDLYLNSDYNPPVSSAVEDYPNVTVCQIGDRWFSLDNLDVAIQIQTTESDNLSSGYNQCDIPRGYSLSQNYPNPFNPTTTINFSITKPGEVNLQILNLNGRLTKEIQQGILSTGFHTLEIDMSDQPNGLYLYKLQSNEFLSIRKMILLK